MKAFVILLLFLALHPTAHSGYSIDGGMITFAYVGKADKSVYVSGNFNKWCNAGESWKMKFDSLNQAWKLSIAKEKVKEMSKENFYEFTFCVDGVLVDAEKGMDDVIFCAGYGYRYTIKGL